MLVTERPLSLLSLGQKKADRLAMSSEATPFAKLPIPVFKMFHSSMRRSSKVGRGHDRKGGLVS